jgi:hypothetical protein
MKHFNRKIISVAFPLLILNPLFGRENPFFSKGADIDIPLSSNYINPPENFSKIVFELPDSARIVDAIEIVYKNIDGSIDRKRVDVDKIIDWKKKFAFSYNYNIPKKREYEEPVFATTTTITKTVKKRTSHIVNNQVVYDKTEENTTILPEEKTKGEIAVTHYIKGGSESENSEDKMGEDADALASLNSQNSAFNTSSEEKAKEKAVSDKSSAIYSKSSIWGSSSSSQTGNLANSNSNIPASQNLSTSSSNLTNTSSTTLQSESKIEEFGDNVKTTEKSKVTLALGKPRFSLLDFNLDENIIKISTIDKKIRHFMLVRPNRIVIDFSREVSFPNQTFDINNGIFKEVKISKNGSSGYRITIYIDEDYRYNLNRTEIGYEIKCYKQ